jgi:elongation factor P
MPVVSTNDLRNGWTLELENVLYTVVDFQHVKPGKGHAFVRTKLKNARTGAVVERTFRSDERVERANIDKREMQYLYRDGEDFVLMDNTSYDQLHVSPIALGDSADFLVESATVIVVMHGDDIIGTELPASVELTIAETEPGIQGDRVSGATKPATLETGRVIQVPLFVGPGEKVKVDTRSGDYLGRV